jgi:hypothetical protein
MFPIWQVYVFIKASLALLVDMSVVSSYRTLLRSIRCTSSREHRSYFERFVTQCYTSRKDLADEQQVRKLARLATEYAAHLTKTAEHASILKKYNMNVNKDGSQRASIESIAARVGLRVPEYHQ